MFQPLQPSAAPLTSAATTSIRNDTNTLPLLEEYQAPVEQQAAVVARGCCYRCYNLPAGGKYVKDYNTQLELREEIDSEYVAAITPQTLNSGHVKRDPLR
jgi:hypothetical protein